MLEKQVQKIESDAEALRNQLAQETDFFGITNKSVIGAGAEHLWVGKAIFDAANKTDFKPDPDFVLKELDVELVVVLDDDPDSYVVAPPVYPPSILVLDPLTFS